MKPCFGYIRVSTQKQGEGVSLEAQKDAITSFASRQNLSIVKWFEERQTAAKGGRPIFNQMLGQLKRGAARGVIIHKIDRSARNLRDWAMFSELPDMGVDVFIATENLDFNSRGGRLTADIQAVIAADYIRNLREETIKGLHGRLKQGLYPFRAPIGYLDNGKGRPKTPDPKTAPLITEMFELYASGRHSLRSLRAEMNRRGLRNAANRPLSLCGIESIINNPFYTGLIVIKRSGKSYRGVHQPLISASLFKRAQDVKAGRNGKVITRHNHVYQGLFRCGLCSGPMSPERQKGNVYYRCQVRECPTKTIREDCIEAQVVDCLRRLEITPARSSRLAASWLRKDCMAEVVGRAEALKLRLSSEEARLNRLADLLIDGEIDATFYHSKRIELELSITNLRQELRNLPDPAAILHERRMFLELMKNLAGLHTSGTAAEKREIVENAFSNRIIVGKNVDLQPREWLQAADLTRPVFNGGPSRYTSRTSSVSKDEDPEKKSLRTMMEAYTRFLVDDDDGTPGKSNSLGVRRWLA